MVLFVCLFVILHFCTRRDYYSGGATSVSQVQEALPVCHRLSLPVLVVTLLYFAIKFKGRDSEWKYNKGAIRRGCRGSDSVGRLAFFVCISSFRKGPRTFKVYKRCFKREFHVRVSRLSQQHGSGFRSSWMWHCVFWACGSRRFGGLWRFRLRGLSRHYVIWLIHLRVTVVSFDNSWVIISILFSTLSILWRSIFYLLEVSGICCAFRRDFLYRIHGNSTMSHWYGVRTDIQMNKSAKWWVEGVFK